MQKIIHVGLLWHTTRSGNLGIGALTAGNMALARAAAAAAGAELKFTILAAGDRGEPYIAGPDIEDVIRLDARYMLSPGGYWRALNKLDCVLDIGGGDSWADIYGPKRFFFLWLTKLLSVLKGKPLVFSPQTIGPFTRPFTRYLASWVMNRARSIVVRDPLSFAVARELAPDVTITQSVDVAFALPFSKPGGGKAKPGIGFNVSGLLYNGGYKGSNEYGLEIDYAALMRRAIQQFLDRGDVDVFLLTHATAPHLPSDDDGAVADLLAKEFPGAVRVPDFRTPSDAKSFISGLDFLVAGRMHACIAAYSSGVPVIPVAYSRKFVGLFDGMLSYPHIIPVTGMSTDEAMTFIVRQFEDRARLTQQIQEGNQRVAGQLKNYTDELEALFAGIRTAS